MAVCGTLTILNYTDLKEVTEYPRAGRTRHASQSWRACPPQGQQSESDTLRPEFVHTRAFPAMTPEAVLNIIDQARRQEARSGEFFRQMRVKAAALPGSIVVEGYQPATCLFQFALEYIEMAPRLIQCVDDCARRAGKSAEFRPLITSATRYFTQPSILLAHYAGLDGLLIKAYLCHRLMEEMYENNHSTRRSQLVHMDVTRANLLAHQMIGEPFANELDQSIIVTMLQIAGSPDYYELNLDPFVNELRNEAWDWMREYWENLLTRNHIRFTLLPGT